MLFVLVRVTTSYILLRNRTVIYLGVFVFSAAVVRKLTNRLWIPKGKNEQCTPNILLQRYYEKFDIDTYLGHCRNVINLAFGIIPRSYRRTRRRLHDDDSDNSDAQDASSEQVLWKRCLGEVEQNFTYIVAHARLFGDQAKNMCMLKSESLLTTVSNCVEDTNMFRKQHPRFDFLLKIDEMIESLGQRYDEAKYMVLNTNMTYLTLIILRLSVQDEMEFTKCFSQGKTREDYRNLCPHPLGSELPRLNKYFITRISCYNLQLPLSLVINTYLNVEDELTKTILQVTCMDYAEWYEMELPMLFQKVVDLYGLESGRLWDLLSFEKTSDSLIELAKFYNNIYRQKVAKPDSNDYYWMPYKIARMGKVSYNKKLSASQNVYLCTILACIVDYKLDTKKSNIRNSEWAKDRIAKKTGLKIAKAFQQFYALK